MREVTKIHQKELKAAAEGFDMAALVDTLKAELIKSLAGALMAQLEDGAADNTTQLPRRGAAPASDAERPLNFYEEVRRFEVKLIQWALLQTEGRQAAAARLLQIKTTTLNNKIKQYRINWRMR